MIPCPYCGAPNYEGATECRKCDAPFVSHVATIYKRLWVGPQKAHAIRSKALSAIVLGLLIKVYWGGYGPWPVVDSPTLADLRAWFEPWLIYGGAVAYVLGWILKRI